MYAIIMCDFRVKSAILYFILRLEWVTFWKIAAACNFLWRGCKKSQSQIAAANRTHGSISIEIIIAQKIAVANRLHESLGLEVISVFVVVGTSSYSQSESSREQVLGCLLPNCGCKLLLAMSQQQKAQRKLHSGTNLYPVRLKFSGTWFSLF